jgi:hypothetical protein
MFLPGTNFEGAVVFLGGMGLAIAAGKIAGVADESPLTIAGGALVVALDLFLRFVPKRPESAQQRPGPTMLFIPAWVLGVFWIGLGIFDTLSGHA